MIAKYFIELVVFLCGSFLSTLSGVFPSNDGLSNLATCVTSVLGITTQASNFLYFIFGDYMFGICTLLSLYFPFKFLSVPIFSFVRKFIAWGGGG